ncbi:MAG: LytTR family DNA-binding domain-containing protein [Pseudomonadota bacterium]
MIRARLVAVLVAFLVLQPFAGRAAPFAAVEPASARVCPVDDDTAPPPDFDAEGCEDVYWRSIDPQGRALWVRLGFDLGDGFSAPEAPLGLFVLAKASSAAQLNGRSLGRNGRPSADPADEIAGRMDHVYFIPESALRPGENEVVLKLSAHHGLLKLGYPVHWIAIAEYADPIDAGLRRYWPSLLPLGALLAGALYFGAMAARGEDRIGSFLLALLSLAAAGQLAAEVARGVVPYPYPAHDVRLLAILGFSAAFGTMLAALILRRFMARRLIWGLAAIALLTMSLVLISPGFDAKSTNAALAPTVASIGVVAWAALRRAPRALSHLAGLGLFLALILFAPGRFLDAHAFYAASGLILFLFVQQAGALADERTRRRGEEARALRLEQALAEAEAADSAPRIAVKSTGGAEFVAVGDICWCKAAGDYVELRLADGRTLLHSSGLSAMEDELPPGFLRVHRSFLVNTARLRSLKREPSGVGVLTMANGETVPVSRRIMPSVRSALT